MAHDEEAPNSDIVPSNDTKLKPPNTSKLDAFLAELRLHPSLSRWPVVLWQRSWGILGNAILTSSKTPSSRMSCADLEQMHVDITRLNDSFYATFLQALEVARRTNEQDEASGIEECRSEYRYSECP